MSPWHKRVELLANVAIVVVAIILGVVLVNRYLLPGSTQPEAVRGPASEIKPGTKLSIPGVEWGGAERTLVMALSTTCRYCTESAPFYQKLAQEKAKHADVSLLAVLPQSGEESQKYLGGLGVKVDDVRQATPTSFGVSGTPTLILLDREGAVLNSWVGKLPPEREAEVLDRFLAGRAGD